MLLLQLLFLRFFGPAPDLGTPPESDSTPDGGEPPCTAVVEVTAPFVSTSGAPTTLSGAVVLAACIWLKRRTFANRSLYSGPSKPSILRASSTHKIQSTLRRLCERVTRKRLGEEKVGKGSYPMLRIEIFFYSFTEREQSIKVKRTCKTRRRVSDGRAPPRTCGWPSRLLTGVPPF